MEENMEIGEKERNELKKLERESVKVIISGESQIQKKSSSGKSEEKLEK